MAQLILLCKRVSPDIDPLILFLTTKVKVPDEDDWGKLKHGLMYLKGNIYTKIQLKEDSLSIIRWWVDTSYVVHWDCKGHTGGDDVNGQGRTCEHSEKTQT